MSKLVARIASVAAIALAAVPILATGAAHADTRRARIVIRDIDFSRADHLAKFDRRVARAAFEICPLESRQNSAKAEACREDLRRQAVAQLGKGQRAKLAQAETQGFAVAAK